MSAETFGKANGELLKRLSFCVRESYTWLESPMLTAKDKVGEAVALTGNGAAARGIVEGGAKVVTYYPGFPIEAAADFVTYAADRYGIYVECSVNEKVAVEVAGGAAISGVRSAAIMKDLGLNVASDFLEHLRYSGVTGGMVILSGSDPGALTSPSEMDARHYAPLFRFMGLAPSTPQEAKDMTVEAFRISEKVELPVFVYFTAQLSYQRGGVILGSIDREALNRTAQFKKDLNRWFQFYVFMLNRKKWWLEQWEKIKSVADKLEFNRLRMKGDEKLGIITSGVPYLYVKDALRELDAEEEVALLKVGSYYPLPRSMVEDLLSTVERVMIVEELEPFIEQEVLRIAGETRTQAKIRGKFTKDFPEIGQFNPDQVFEKLAEFLGKSPSRESFESDLGDEVKRIALPFRFTSCSGCPHIASAYVLKEAAKKVKHYRRDFSDDFIWAGDIGCEGMFSSVPYSIMDFVYCMGSSIGVASGMYQAGAKQTLVAVIGDSTIQHAGLPSILNATYNKADLLVYVLDNRTCAASGHAPTPNIGVTQLGTPTKESKIEEIVKAFNVNYVDIVDPYDVKNAQKAIEKALQADGVRVVISKRECRIVTKKQMKCLGQTVGEFRVNPATCNGCRICMRLGCHAMYMDEERNRALIDEYLCQGCEVCARICPLNAIHRVS